MRSHTSNPAPAPDIRASVLSLHSEWKLTEKNAKGKCSGPDSVEETQNPGKQKQVDLASYSSSAGIQAPHNRDPTTKDEPTSALHCKEQKLQHCLLKKKIKIGPGGAALSSQLLGNLRQRGPEFKATPK